ncbi:anthranilate synthase component I, partial [Candidatus Peregrinibacteria bacterium]|nr:anthranilate synthase component I [Candidatus Peregrinibacteria bacterium]
EVGTVIVPAEKYIQRFSSVMHMISDVTGNLREGKDMFDVFRACFPAGTLSGAPKIRAAELISGLEKRQRGIYGGAVGYFDFSGNMDFAIAIRTMVCKENKAYIQAGAGIVYDSVPEREHEECLHKAKSCLSVL